MRLLIETLIRLKLVVLDTEELESDSPMPASNTVARTALGKAWTSIAR